MTTTTLARSLQALSVALLAAAAWTGSIAPAALATAIISTSEATRRRAAHATTTATRTTSQSTIHLDQQITITTKIQSHPALPITHHEQIPARTTLHRQTTQTQRGQSTTTTHVVATEPGTTTIGANNHSTTVTDEWGLNHHHTKPPPTQTIRILPPTLPGAPTQRRRGPQGARLTAALYRSHPAPDVDRLRGWIPSDRARDIDWRHASVPEGMRTRIRGQELHEAAVVLVQATATMTRAQTARKITTAARIAASLLRSPEGGGAHAELGYWTAHEHALLRRRDSARRVDRLFDIPPRPGTQHNDHFDALAKQIRPSTRRSRRIVSILDAETTPRHARRTITRLARDHEHVLIIIPTNTSHAAPRSQQTKKDLPEFVTARRNRYRIARHARKHRIPTLLATPTNVAAVTQEVHRWLHN